MTKYVSVGCKLPNGLKLTLGEKEIELKGFNQNLIQSTEENFAVTENVDEEFFDAWLAKHKDFAIVKNGIVFKAKNNAEAVAQAKDKKTLKSGLEQLNPEKEGVKPAN